MVEHMFVTYGESWLMIDFLFLFILLQALQLSGFFKDYNYMLTADGDLFYNYRILLTGDKVSKE